MSKENGFVPLRRGLWEHVRDGRMTITEAVAFIYICSQADTRTGVWKGCAKSLSGELGIPERTARDVLEKMEHGDYIRRFAVPGLHSCYPILVHKFPITQGEHNGEQLNALESQSPVDLRYFSREQSVEHGASQKRQEKKDKRNASAKKSHPPKRDDSFSRSLPLHEKAKQTLLQRNPEEAAFIEQALQMIEVRAHNSGRNPRTVAYYLAAYENLKESEKDWEVVDWYAKSPQSSDHLSRVNSLILKAEVEGKRTGRDVIECFHNLKQDPHCYDRLAIPQKEATA
jgi:hypothetical protein